MISCLPHRELIAGGPICQVEECTCGVLHVTIGVFTLRLDPNAILSLWSTLGEAVQRIEDRRARDPGGARPQARPS